MEIKWGTKWTDATGCYAHGLNYDIQPWKQEGLLAATNGHITSTIHHHPIGIGRDPFES